MTIEELYEWAKENNALDCDLKVRDLDGDYTSYIEPCKVVHSYSDGTHYTEVEL